MARLTRQEVQEYLAAAEDSFPHDACLTCECFLGYVTRLRIDSNESSRESLNVYRVERKSMHSCLGCDPCPPGDLYAEYVRQRPGLPPAQSLTVL